ncbi:AAA family ATPase [Rhodoferax fermentans]|uniref:AAA+ ATPase domain-containing protein n=1 Tax=Rhodoferax fermentans TaxID=28066 RepID=A0A1T1ATN7_RHOFE|nr:ATP-binding protein [Rhodoferax fermentans]MBK1685013.1 hypothetical protein [Rhodoferax fermentans]OOV07427.1 hypothetical protein RF819_12430 [Rhodoferax fermentans]
MHAFFDDYDEGGQSTLETWGLAFGQDVRQAYRSRLAQWILLITTGAGGLPPYSAGGSPDWVRQAEITGVPELADPHVNAMEVTAALQRAAQALPAQLVSIGVCRHKAVVDWLAQGAGLSELEHNILDLALALKCFAPLARAIQTWQELDHGALVQAVATLLHSQPADVARALSPEGQLHRSALVTLYGGASSLGHMLKVPRNISMRLPMVEHPSQIYANIVTPMPPARCQLGDFAYMAQSTQLARSWLLGALHSAKALGQAGHLLVYGEPGLGKTEWVRALVAQVLSAEVAAAPASAGTMDQEHQQVFELVVHDGYGLPMSGVERLANLRLVLQLKRRSPNTVLIFDEADDVFKGSDGSDEPGSADSAAVSMRNHRASLNRLIEDSPLPVIWIMNRPEVLDPAVLRRFDSVISFERMPRAVKRALLQSAGVADEPQAKLWSKLPGLTPALIDRLAHLRRSAAAAGQPMDVALSQHWLRQRLTSAHDRQLLGRVMGQHANGHATSSGNTELDLGSWRADQVHASQDLQALMDGIAQWGHARILLHGQPGTGKTAFAHALADGVDRPLLIKRASDLLGAYVGETERSIRSAFEEADDEEAVLFIDEVDSLLAQRSQAVRTWEISQVNELLEHLGDAPGVVILATNRLDALDPAVIRRMDVRVEFKALTAEQGRLSFKRLCAQLQLPCTGQAIADINLMTGLTPGDFAQVARRWRFSPEVKACPPDQEAQLLVGWLQQECQFRGQEEPSIGFLSGLEKWVI